MSDLRREGLRIDMIPWCFLHDDHAKYNTTYGRWCTTWEILATDHALIPCDIAMATRPRRIK